MTDSTGNLAVDQLAIWAAAFGAIAGLAVLIGRLVRWLLRTARRVEDVLDDYLGEPERPGVPARPGVMERIGRIEHELYPNSGSSLRDAVDRLEASICGTNRPPT